MSLPYKMDPLGTDDCESHAETEYSEVCNGSIIVNSVQYLLNYRVQFNLNFPYRGYLQWTHIILPHVYIDTTSVPSSSLLYVGLTNKSSTPSESDFMFLAENPVLGGGTYTNLVCKTYIHNTPMECGPSCGMSEIFDYEKPLFAKSCQPSVFTKNDDGTYTWVDNISFSSAKKKYVNILAENVSFSTTAPDNKQHVLILGPTTFSGVPTVIGAKFKYLPTIQ